MTSPLNLLYLEWMNGFVRTKISLLAQILEGHSHLIIVSDLMIMMKLSAPVVAYNIYHYSWERPIHEGKLPLPTPPLLPIKEYSKHVESSICDRAMSFLRNNCSTLRPFLRVAGARCVQSGIFFHLSISLAHTINLFYWYKSLNSRFKAFFAPCGRAVRAKRDFFSWKVAYV